MKLWLKTLLLIPVLASAGAVAQIQIPTVVQLPPDDFVWNWGRKPRGETTRAEFTIHGGEEKFICTLTGAFRISSRMRDFENQREFEFDLGGTLYFIQESTYTLNYYYRAGELQWATLDCMVPETDPTEEKVQERLDRALERAERARERRRRRDEDAED